MEGAFRFLGLWQRGKAGIYGLSLEDVFVSERYFRRPLIEMASDMYCSIHHIHVATASESGRVFRCAV